MGITLSGISLSGINSGIDSDLIVRQMMAVASQPLYRLQARKTEWNAKNAALEQIESLLNSLKSHAGSMDTIAELRKTTAKSSDNDIVTATASSTAIEGSHTVTVHQLARAEREVQTTGVATLETIIYTESDNIFTYTYNGTQRSVTVQEEHTLEDLVETINADDSNAGITASILQYDGAYHLVLAGNDTGETATITVDTSPASIGGFTETQTAQSAEIKVDGFPPGAEDWIERDSNSITDVLPGVTLNLQSVSGSGVTITLTRKTSELTSDLTNFIAIYNSLADKIKQLTKYNAETETGAILQGDSMINGMLSEIRSEVISRALGFADGEDPLTLAAELGIELDDEGVMTLDESVLASALSDDYLGVLSLVGADKTGTSASQYVDFLGAGDNTQAGEYTVEASFDDTTGELLGFRVKAPGSETWNPDVDIDGSIVTGRYGFPEEGMVLEATWDGQAGVDGVRTQITTVRVRQGFVGRVMDSLESVLDSETGLMATKKSHISSQISTLDANIEIQEARLERKEARLKAQYARLEATLARFDSQRGAFEAMIMQLDAMQKASNE